MSKIKKLKEYQFNKFGKCRSLAEIKKDYARCKVCNPKKKKVTKKTKTSTKYVGVNWVK